MADNENTEERQISEMASLKPEADAVPADDSEQRTKSASLPDDVLVEDN